MDSYDDGTFGIQAIILPKYENFVDSISLAQQYHVIYSHPDEERFDPTGYHEVKFTMRKRSGSITNIYAWVFSELEAIVEYLFEMRAVDWAVVANAPRHDYTLVYFRNLNQAIQFKLLYANLDARDTQ